MAPAGHNRRTGDDLFVLNSSTTLRSAMTRPALCQALGKGLGHTTNKKKAWSCQAPHSITPFNARTAAILDHATFTLAFLPLGSTLHTRKLQVCTALPATLCLRAQFTKLTKISGPRFHLCARGLSSRPIQYPIKGLIFKSL